MPLLLLLFGNTAGYGQFDRAEFDNWIVLLNQGVESKTNNLVEDALHYFFKAKHIAQNNLTNHPADIISINNIYKIIRQIEPSKCESLLNEVLSRTKNKYGISHVFTKMISDSLNNTNAFIDSEKDIANIYYNTLYAFSETLDHADLGSFDVIKELALAQAGWKNYESALYYFEIWEDLNAEDLKAYYFEYANTLNKYAHILENNNDLKTASRAHENVVYYIEQDPSLRDTYFEDTYRSLVFLNRSLENYEAAISYGDKLIDYYKEKYDAQDFINALIYNELAYCYEKTSQTDLAKLYYSAATMFYTYNDKIEDPYYQTIRNNYFNILTESDEDNKEKLSILNEEIEYYKFWNKKEDGYIKSLNQYISLAISTAANSFELSLLLNDKLKYYTRKQDFTAQYISAFENLSNLHIRNFENEKAYALLENNKTNLKQLKPEYGEVYYTCALIAFGKSTAKELTDEEQELYTITTIEYIDLAINYYKSINAPYIEFAELIKVKAVALYSLEKKTEGESLFYKHKNKLEIEGLTKTNEYADMLQLETNLINEGNSIEKQKLRLINAINNYDADDPITKENYIFTINEYAKVLAKNKEYDEAAKHYLNIYQYYIEKLEKEIKYKSSSSNSFQINQSALDFFSELQYFNYLTAESNKQVQIKALEAALLSKNLLLNVSNNVLNKLRSLDDSNLNEIINSVNHNLIKASSSIDWLNHMGTEESITLAKDIERGNRESYDSMMEYYFQNYNDKLLSISDYRDIFIQPNSVLLDFARIIDLDGHFAYIVYLYEPNSISPEIIYLGLEETLKNLTTTDDLKTLAYSSRGSKGKTTKTIMDHGKKLYEFLWKPIETKIADYEIISFSFDGLLNKIPLANLQDENGEILLHKYILNQISNPTVLINQQSVNPDLSDILIYGGIDYSESSTNTSSDFQYLPGTKKEAESLKSLFPNSRVLSNDKASESHFRSLSGKSPSVLHIATHGFYFEYDKDPIIDYGKRFKTNKNPMKRTGLLLSNGNKGMSSAGRLDTDGLDGVLTSIEIAYSDLRNTDLVVLSACETGLGDISGSEGIYGLQRAFKMAGVNLILLTLWEIPDAETQEFMEYFYSDWRQSNNVKTAFRNTQKYMHNKYGDSPDKWAAFILLE